MGFAADPLAFTPREHCSWTHRFDDPERQYRTLYCAEHRITCLRETLATFRQNARVVAEYRALFGELPDAGAVPREWLERHALAPGRIEIRDGELASVDDPALRHRFEREHVGLLVAHGMEHLDVSEVRSRAASSRRRSAASCSSAVRPGSSIAPTWTISPAPPCSSSGRG